MAAIRDVVEIDLRSAAGGTRRGIETSIARFVRTEQLTPLVYLQRLPRIQHRRALQIADRRRVVRIGHVDRRHSATSPSRTVRLAVIGADVLLVPELGRLPVGAGTPNLTDQLQVAVKPVEAAGAQSGRHLSLKGGLGMIISTAHGF